MLKTVFFGTPGIAVPFLETLARVSQVIGVVTSPDRPAGRGYVITAPEVKRAAESLGLPIRQPTNLKDFSLPQEFGDVPDVGLVVAYGRLLPPSIFSAPRGGLVNVHFSLVPQYRGAGPIQWALIRGEQETGVSLFQIEKGLDTGPVFMQKKCSIDPLDNAATLRDKLVPLGSALTEEFVKRWESGPWSPTPQTGSVSLAPALKKEDGQIRWSAQSAPEVANLVRGTYEWPGARARIQGHQIKIRRAEADSGGGNPNMTSMAGTVLALDRARGFLVKCASGTLWVRRVQPEGKKEMNAVDFWNGARLSPGDRFDSL